MLDPVLPTQHSGGWQRAPAAEFGAAAFGILRLALAEASRASAVCPTGGMRSDERRASREQTGGAFFGALKEMALERLEDTRLPFRRITPHTIGRRKMNMSPYAAGAATLSVLLLSSSAFAFCFTEKSYAGGIDRAECVDQGVQAGIEVTDLGGRTYLYTVAASGQTSVAGGVLLDDTGSVLIGTRARGVRGPCNESVARADIAIGVFICGEADAPVAFIRVFAE
jgi:hypothetical protein